MSNEKIIHNCDRADQPDIHILCNNKWTTPNYNNPNTDDYEVYRDEEGELYTFSDLDYYDEFKLQIVKTKVTCPDCLKILQDKQKKELNQKKIADEIIAERARQDKKWGEQNHPSIRKFLLNTRAPFKPYEIADEYKILDVEEAKRICDLMTARGDCTWADIAIEEMCEAVCTTDENHRREELVQLAAVVMAWIESIDRNKQ